MLNITLQGEQVTLLPERALYWPAQKTLVVSDLHWGKAAHFRKHGIAIPAGTQLADEARLATLIQAHGSERLVIAGDMFHSRENKEVNMFVEWRKTHSALHIDLVTGNHDILPSGKYQDWNMALHRQGLQLGPFFISHDVVKDCDTFCIHGHVHPAIRIARRGHGSIKLCCFCQDDHRLILPAFGRFTGNYLLKPDEHRHLYVIADKEVLQWQ